MLCADIEVKLMRRMENHSSSTNIQQLMTSLFSDTFSDQQLNNLSSLHTLDPHSAPYDHEQARTLPVSETLVDSSLPFSATPSAQKNRSLIRNKRKRNNNGHEVEEKPKEVIHVRAKRGQATDSHSLAERVRREKINEKLRCLQDLVPGCYKAMGMAVMLDVIIDYVQCLQHQVEFLSMKLAAASMHFDFNTSEMAATETLQRNIGIYEVQEMGKTGEEGFGGYTYLNPTWPLR